MLFVVIVLLGFFFLFHRSIRLVGLNRTARRNRENRRRKTLISLHSNTGGKKKQKLKNISQLVNSVATAVRA